MAPQMPKERTVYRRSRGLPPYNLERHTEALPSPLPPMAVLIQVCAVSLNYRDANMLNGTNPWPIVEAGMPASDAAGDVVAVGEYVTKFRPGDKVCHILDQHSFTGEEQSRCWLSADVDGVLGTHIIFDELSVLPMPKHLTYAEAACLANAGVTAWSAIATEGKKLVTGQTIVLQGTGGVSIMAMKLALAAGNKVIITSSSDEKLERIKALMKSDQIHGINYNTIPDWDQQVLRLNDGVGADIIIDNGGTPSTLKSLRAAKKGGIVSQVGYLGKQDSKDLDGLIALLIDKTVNFRGINCGSKIDFERLNRVIEVSKLRFEDVIDKKFHFDQAKEAFEYLWSGKHVGKIVIEV